MMNKSSSCIIFYIRGKIMKKTRFILIIPVLVLSCASRKPAVNQPRPAENPPPAKEQAAPPPPAKEPVSGDIILEGAKPYRVIWTDTLSKIACRQYGSQNGYYFPLIMLASRDVVRDPDVIVGGTRLTVPDLQRNLNDPGARQRLKMYINEVADLYNNKPRVRWSAETRNRLRALASSL
jgi:hypothetical protein